MVKRNPKPFKISVAAVVLVLVAIVLGAFLYPVIFPSKPLEVKIGFYDGALRPTNDWNDGKFGKIDPSASENIPNLPDEYKNRKALVINEIDGEGWKSQCESEKVKKIGSSFVITANAVLFANKNTQNTNNNQKKDVSDKPPTPPTNDKIEKKDTPDKSPTAPTIDNKPKEQKLGFGLFLKYGDIPKPKYYKLGAFLDPNKTPEIKKLHKFQIVVSPVDVSFMIDEKEARGQSSVHLAETASKFPLISEIDNKCIGFFVEDPKLHVVFYDLSIEESKSNLDNDVRQLTIAKNNLEKRLSDIEKVQLPNLATKRDLKDVLAKLEKPADNEEKIAPSNPVTEKFKTLGTDFGELRTNG